MLQNQRIPIFGSDLVALTWYEGIETIRYDISSGDEQLSEMRITCGESVTPCLNATN